MPGTSPDTSKLGPGTLTLGETGTEIDFSCQVIGCTLTPAPNAEDDIYTLGGCVIPGDRTYAYTIAGSLYQDHNTPGGIVEFSWTNIGVQVPFTFTPNSAAGSSWAGVLTMDPLPVGHDTANEKMVSDFEWACVGVPVPTFGATAPPLGDGTSRRDAIAEAS